MQRFFGVFRNYPENVFVIRNVRNQYIFENNKGFSDDRVKQWTYLIGKALVIVFTGFWFYIHHIYEENWRTFGTVHNCQVTLIFCKRKQEKQINSIQEKHVYIFLLYKICVLQKYIKIYCGKILRIATYSWVPLQQNSRKQK